MTLRVVLILGLLFVGAATLSAALAQGLPAAAQETAACLAAADAERLEEVWDRTRHIEHRLGHLRLLGLASLALAVLVPLALVGVLLFRNWNLGQILFDRTLHATRRRQAVLRRAVAALEKEFRDADGDRERRTRLVALLEDELGRLDRRLES